MDDDWLQSQLSQHLSNSILVTNLVDIKNMMSTVRIERWHDQTQVSICEANYASEVEGAAVAELRLDPDVSSHEVDQTLGDRQSKTCTTEFLKRLAGNFWSGKK